MMGGVKRGGVWGWGGGGEVACFFKKRRISKRGDEKRKGG